jgi:hypothetical protein
VARPRFPGRRPQHDGPLPDPIDVAVARKRVVSCAIARASDALRAIAGGGGAGCDRLGRSVSRHDADSRGVNKGLGARQGLNPCRAGSYRDRAEPPTKGLIFDNGMMTRRAAIYARGVTDDGTPDGLRLRCALCLTAKMTVRFRVSWCILSRAGGRAVHQVFTAQPVRRREFEPRSKRRERRAWHLPPGMA